MSSKKSRTEALTAANLDADDPLSDSDANSGSDSDSDDDTAALMAELQVSFLYIICQKTDFFLLWFPLHFEIKSWNVLD